MSASIQDLEHVFRQRGVLTARDLSAALGVSQPTISRLLTAAGSRLLRLGRARTTRYAMRRSVAGEGSCCPLYSIGTDGNAGLTGHLHALEGGQWCLEQEEPWDTLRGSEFHDGIYPGLPWYIDDLRPRGFLGRHFARRYAEDLGSSQDPRRWSDDEVAEALVRFGDNLPGAFVLGEKRLSAVQKNMFRPQRALDNDSRGAEYPRLAEATLGGTLPGSSAAGEQPKFTACVRDVDGGQRHVIVKFSGAIGQAEGRRWADLLLAEHVANTILMQSGIPCAITDVVDGGERRFLESTRFDREGDHGRRNIVSLEALDAAFFGEIDTPWTDAAGRLHADDWISESDADLLSLQWWFGTLIGNTDMHYGNVSLFLGPNRPLSLAPIYDMVPMLYRPRDDGSIVYDQLDPQAPPPEARPLWTRAASMAEAFWSRLSETGRVSSEFRELAGRNGELVSTYRERFSG